MRSDFLNLVLKQSKELFLPLLGLTVSLFLGAKFLLPKIAQISKLHWQLKKNETQVLALEKKAVFLEDQKEKGLASSFKKIEQVFPGEKKVGALLALLEEAKKGTDLKFTRLGLKPGVLATQGAALKSKKEGSFKFNLGIFGAYDEVVLFLEKFHHTAPLTEVEKINISFGPGKEEIKANLSLRTYYLPVGDQKIVLEKPLPLLSSPLKKVLEELLEFEVVSFSAVLPEEKVGKENPFSY